MKHMIRAAVAAMAISVAAAPLAASAAHAKTLRMISGFPTNFIFTEEIAKTFIENVRVASNGELTIELIGPDAVPTFEQFEPVQAGVFEMLFTHPAYHSGTTAVGLAIDAIDVDPDARRSSGVFSYIQDHYTGHGMRLLSAPGTGTKGFRYYMREPVSGTPGMDGLKIRGTVSYHPMIRALGGAPVNMPGGEVYTSLEKGTIDGAAWGLTGAKDFKWYEVAGYLADPTFGQVGVMIFMNGDAWSGLTDAERALLAEEGKKLEVWSRSRFDALAGTELEELKGLGMKMTAFDPAEAVRFETLWAEGVWEVAEKISGEAATKLRDLAKANGLTQ